MATNKQIEQQHGYSEQQLLLLRQAMTHAAARRERERQRQAMRANLDALAEEITREDSQSVDDLVASLRR
jgi:hypothetical protein